MIQATRNLIEQRRQAERLDPVLLAKRAGIEPDPWQCELLRSEARQIILLCSRQAGKSTVSALLALHTALFRPGSLVLLLAPALRQSQELFRKLKASLNSLPAQDVLEESALRLEFSNQSRIVCLPGKEATIRGFSDVSLLIVDEASRVSDDLYHAIRPMLAVSRGRVALLSTPFGKRGFFHKECEEGGPDWQRVKITAYDCPRIDKQWLDDERRMIGDWWFRQEYLCEFVDTVDQVFATEHIQAALSRDVESLDWWTR